MAAVRRRLVVSGKVQGVFFREGAKSQADMLRIKGWARNLDNGDVEVVAEGEPGAVEQLARWCREGPPRARVTKVDSRNEVPEGLAAFRTL